MIPNLTTMSDANLSTMLAHEQRLAPELKAAAEHAAKQLEENTAAIDILTAEADFRTVVKELRRKSGAARVNVLRTLAEAERPADIDGPTEWLLSRKLIRAHRVGIDHRRHLITDLGRRALTLVESA